MDVKMTNSKLEGGDVCLKCFSRISNANLIKNKEIKPKYYKKL